MNQTIAHNHFTTQSNDTAFPTYFHRNGEPLSAQRAYMNRIYAMEQWFGHTFFRVTQRSARVLPETPYVGIHHQGELTR